jgi:hypothetical protein
MSKKSGTSMTIDQLKALGYHISPDGLATKVPTTNKTNKYGAVKTKVNGKVFDSKAESKRYVVLSMLEKLGEITNLRTQVPYILHSDKDIDRCKEYKIRPIKYLADFVYLQDGMEVVEDCKGHRTQIYIMKNKLMKIVHGIEIKETK